MLTPFSDRDLPEYLMVAMMRFEEEAYRAGQHGCCVEGASKMANPSSFASCAEHGPRATAALSLLCHALGEWCEDIVGRCAEAVVALAPRCPACRGTGIEGARLLEINARSCPACSRGKAFAHWDKLNGRDRP